LKLYPLGQIALDERTQYLPFQVKPVEQIAPVEPIQEFPVWV
jgi:hypothetical protein